VQWDDLRVFLAVAQGGRLRQAARALQLGQPTIGRHLHQPHEYFRPMVWLAKRLGDRVPRVRASRIALRYWLLVHPDLKAVPRVRHVMERIRGVFKASRAALRG
jgi:DNA-binding transcriptional LysR family regulator